MLNESESIRALFDRLFPVLEGLGESFEVVAIDDGSTDPTLELLEAEREVRPELRVLSFARNFGQHAAVIAGFETSRGEWVITLDADLQNPPEEIPKLVDAFRQGHDLVNTWREGRQDTFFRRIASRITNALVRRFSGIGLRDFGCMLRGYHRHIVQRMVHRKEFRTFIPALAMLYARSPVEVPVAHSAREQGSSNYSLFRLFSLQLDLMTSFSTTPLRLLFTLGWLIAFLGLGFAALLILLRILQGPEWAAQGVFTLFAILFFFVGAQFLAFGLLGEYIGRIYQEVRERPTYVLRETDTEARE
jgi:undecaprenyl-phosphate 4-deoxy-4-formamido-L-arabinose transferase